VEKNDIKKRQAVSDADLQEMIDIRADEDPLRMR
jgi:hypothetical protein